MMPNPNRYLNEIARAAARAEMIKGVLWSLGAAVISGVTYISAEPGGTYVVFWGALAYGGYRLLRGLYYWANPDALARRITKS